MADDTGAAAGATADAAAAAANDKGAGAGADPNKNTDNTGNQTFDPSKISDEEFAKVFDDPRTFTHSRFKELSTQARKAKEYEEKEVKEREAKLLEEKKFTELLAEKEKQIQGLQEQTKANVINSKIITQSQKLGAVDPEAVTQLINRTNIVLNDDGTIAGVDEALKTLATEKAYLFKNPNADISVGSGTNPGADGTAGIKKFKASQIKDFKFYTANQKEIDEAFKNGQIEDDVNFPAPVR